MRPATHRGSVSFTDTIPRAVSHLGAVEIPAAPLRRRPVEWAGAAPPGFPPEAAVEQLCLYGWDSWDFTFGTLITLRARGAALARETREFCAEARITLVDEDVRGMRAAPLAGTWTSALELKPRFHPDGEEAPPGAAGGNLFDFEFALRRADVHFSGVPSRIGVKLGSCSAGCSASCRFTAPLEALLTIEMRPAAQPTARLALDLVPLAAPGAWPAPRTAVAGDSDDIWAAAAAPARGVFSGGGALEVACRYIEGPAWRRALGGRTPFGPAARPRPPRAPRPWTGGPGRAALGAEGGGRRRHAPAQRAPPFLALAAPAAAEPRDGSA
jgi:hypothetical protein